jgi:hypothetical protein
MLPRSAGDMHVSDTTLSGTQTRRIADQIREVAPGLISTRGAPVELAKITISTFEKAAAPASALYPRPKHLTRAMFLLIGLIGRTPPDRRIAENDPLQELLRGHTFFSLADSDRHLIKANDNGRVDGGCIMAAENKDCHLAWSSILPMCMALCERCFRR